MALVNNSLIQPDYTGRYHIHELLRQFGSEKLREAGETDRTRDRHLEFFLNVAEESEPYLWGSEQVTWINQLELEHDNLRAALEWGLRAEGKANLGLLLAGSLEFFWSSRCLFDEGREHLSAALSRPESFDRTTARAKALHAAGHLAYVQSDYPATLPLLEESISIYRDLGPTGRRGLANALITLGDMETELGDYATASSLMTEGLGIMRELKDLRGIARALWQLGQCAVRPGDYEQAVQYFEMALPLLRQIGDKSHTAIALSGLAEVAVRRGDNERAFVLEEQSLALRREINETWGIAISLANFAWIALRQDDLQQAVVLLAESLTLRHEIGDKGGIAWCLEKLAEIALTKGQRESTLKREEDFRRAARLFGAAEALRAPVNSTIDMVDQPEYERQVAIVRAQLDEAAFTAAWTKGQAMTLEQTIEYALAVELDPLGVAK
jgi:non-specific serine/threonine protein kinase